MKILLIEDDIVFAEGLKMGLVRHGLVVDIINAGEKAIDLVIRNNHSYDLILLDISLPEMNGLKVCDLLREKNILTPVLMLTGNTDVNTKVDALNRGADDYLTKPFYLPELVARIQALLRRPANVNQVELTVAGIKINPRTRAQFPPSPLVKRALEIGFVLV